jgi:hypothetical protein
MTTELDIDDVCAGHPKAALELRNLRLTIAMQNKTIATQQKEKDALVADKRRLVGLLLLIEWRATGLQAASMNNESWLYERDKTLLEIIDA